MMQIEWVGLYSESWQGEIVPEAFSHPAKFSRALIRQIYKYMIDEGLLQAGDKVVDSFAGVALGALDAMRLGLHWVGVELEPKFHELGNQNIDLWNARYAPHFPTWGTAVLHQGDSRNLAQIIGQAGGAVSSPPFQGTLDMNSGAELLADVAKRHGNNRARWENGEQKDYGSSPGQLGSMPAGSLDAALSSPPYASGTVHGRNGIDLEKTQRPGHNSQAATMDSYGATDGQLSNLPAGDFSAAVTSPAYVDTISNGDGPGARFDPVHHPNNHDKVSSQASYGETDGQMGRMSGAVTSPPFERSNNTGGATIAGPSSGMFNGLGKNDAYHSSSSYGATNGNIGNDQGDTFWQASRVILEQLYQVLKPGAAAAFVCGDFVRGGKRVHFGQQWLDLCTAVGFEPYAWAIAWKREPGPVQMNAFGEDVDHTKDRVSFFRRLANQKNPRNAILNEDVLIVRKPLNVL